MSYGLVLTVALFMTSVSSARPLFSVHPGGLPIEIEEDAVLAVTASTDSESEDDVVHRRVQQLSKMASSNMVTLPDVNGVAAFDVALVNPETGSNVVFRGISPSMGRLRLTKRLLAECRAAGLGSSATYECRLTGRDAGGTSRVHRVSLVSGRANVRLPRLRYHHRGQIRDVPSSERKLASVSLDVPDPIFAPDADAATRERVRHEFYTNALVRGAYRYDYRFPNGDMSSVVDDSDDGEDEMDSESDDATDSSATEGSFVLEDWVDSSRGIIAASETAMTAIRAGCQAWDAVLRISQPVRVRVGFKSYGDSSTLGSSYRPSSYYDSDTGLVYPAALIDQMKGVDMHSNLPDIRITYSTDFAFYFGTDGKCPSTKYDLLSIVTHELCHGLGFTSYHVQGQDGVAPDGSWSSEGPGIFDSFLYYGGARWPTMTNAQRKKSMTSNALYWDGANAKSANGGARIAMYAPSSYDRGSSVSHWDKSVTSAPLMFPSIAKGNVTHAIDKIVLGALKDMGWTLASDQAPVTTYTVTYRPGSSGGGSVVTRKKSKGVSLTLADVLFTRNGYTQTGWSLTDGGAFAYALGAKYTVDANVTLYPYWTATPTTYKVTYRPGSYGTGDVVVRTKTAGKIMTLAGALYTRNGYTQTGWALTDGGTKKYALYGSYSTDANLTLYPVWQAIVKLEYDYDVEGGAARITGYTGKSAAVSIPASINGYPVREIGNLSFAFTDVVSVTVPEGVTNLDAFAFGLCDKLESVSLPSTVISIGGYAYTGSFESYTGAAFIRTPSLKSITVASGNPVYSSSGGILYNNAKTHLVNYPEALNAGGSFVIPSQVVAVSAFAFYGAKLKSITLSESMTEVGMFTFEGSETLEEIVLPKGVLTIERSAFEDCTALKKVTLPDGLESIGENAFANTALTSVDLPASVVSVDATAFAYCSDIEEIVIRSTFETDGAEDKWGSNVDNDQIWVASDCYDYWTGILGGGLRKLESDDPAGARECILTLASGWSWFSVNVTPDDASFATVFKGVAFADEDVIKSSDGSATYYGGKWYPSPETFKLVAGRAYAVKKSTSGSATVKVSGTAAPTSLAVEKGWNWIGVTSSAEVQLGNLSHSAGFTDDDIINSSSGSATYSSGKWWPSSSGFTLVPGVGYKAKFAKAGTVSFE